MVLHQETEEGKYNTLRALVERKDCPAIVYVSRVRRTRELAEKLTGDGFPARPYNGKMDPSEKVANQDAFIRGDARIIVATSAFGMGVDKKDVGLVVHYDISDSLENYIQEAGLRIDQSKHFTDSQRLQAKRIIKALISSRSIAGAGNDLAESRVDYLADVLGMEKRDVIDCVSVMRQEGLLADSMDMSACIFKQDTRNRSAQTLDRFAKLERFLFGQIGYEERGFALKELNEAALDGGILHASVRDIRTILYYLTIKGYIAKQEEGGFLVRYNGLEIKRLILDNKIRYKQEDYKTLDEYYQQKIQQIHIVGEYTNLMVRDYFQMDFRKFIAKYFKGERAAEIRRNITPERYERLFGGLSEAQSRIIRDDESRYIVVAAGPGSGKTRVLVHKLASLLSLEDVKHEQLLMVTFSRAAATEFKKRLVSLIGGAANFVEIKTFHSYCFDLLGKIGSLEGVKNVVRDAAELIEGGGVEPSRIAKTVLVIDEVQDMDENVFRLVRALMKRNEEMRVIAVGDDDQNIYEFRGADSKYMGALIREFGAAQYEMTEKYRSRGNLVALANCFARSIKGRMKTGDIQAVQQENGVRPHQHQ